MTPEQQEHIMELVDAYADATHTNSYKNCFVARDAIEAALSQHAKPTCYKHDEPRKGCAWCDKPYPSEATAEQHYEEQPDGTMLRVGPQQAEEVLQSLGWTCTNGVWTEDSAATATLATELLRQRLQLSWCP